MQLDRPLTAITPTVDGDVLLVLARAAAEFTPATVQRLSGRHSVDGVRKALNRLAEQGVVTSRSAGRAVLYSLNREHLLAPSIIEMADIGRELAKRIADRVDGWQVEPVLVAIFGSAASGHMRPDSDIDLLVVRSDHVDPDSASWRSQIVDLEQAVTSWTGNDARVLEFSLTEAQRRPKEHVLEDAIAHGIAVIGDFSALAPQARRTKGSR
jgi:predicted nucleotidyltransferase